MKIYKNNIKIEGHDQVRQGFIIGMIDDAVENLKNESRGGKFTNLTDSEFEEVCDYDYSADNVDDKSLERCFSIVDNFCYDYLDEEQLSAIRQLGGNDRKSFGMDLYQALVYDSEIMDKRFRDAAKKFPSVDASAGIGESVDDDIRVFFE